MTGTEKVVTREADLMWMLWLKFAFGFEVSQTSFGCFLCQCSIIEDEGNESEALKNKINK